MLTQARLKELLHYDPLTGVFTWLQARGYRMAVGDIAGCIGAGGYVMISCDYHRYRAHRLAFLYMTGTFPSSDVDHKNGLRSDNRWSNIRNATRSENMQNIGGAQSNNKLGIVGVHFNKKAKKYQAMIQVHGKNKYLGLFDTIDAASSAYLTAKNSLHPTHVRLRGIA